MGVFWYSEAEVVSPEPEIVKNLIEEINEDKDCTTVYDLEIKGNSIFINSGGYGCYGTYFENPDLELFKKLFERYNGALFAFEHVHPCQCQGYHFNSQWAKPEGEVDWEDDTTYWNYRYMVMETEETKRDGRLDEGLFDFADCWHIELDRLEKNQKHMPMLYTLVQKAKAEGFDEWGNGRIGNREDAPNFIPYDMVYDLIKKYWDKEAENGESIYSPIYDIDRDMTEWVKSGMDVEDVDGYAEFKMPDNFPKLQTTSAW